MPHKLPNKLKVKPMKEGKQAKEKLQAWPPKTIRGKEIKFEMKQSQEL